MSAWRRNVAVHLHRRRAAGGERGRRRAAQPRPQRSDFGRICSPPADRIPLLPYSRHGLNSRNLGRRARLAGLEGRTMPELIPHAPDNPEFARVIERAAAPRPRGFPFDIAPDRGRGGGARPAARRAGGAEAALRRPARARAPAAAGSSTAGSAPRWCRPASSPSTRSPPASTSRSRRSFLPGRRRPAPRSCSSPDEDDEIEPLGERIDLGLVATEALALALPAYPRKPGATLGRRRGGGDRTTSARSPSRRSPRCAGKSGKAS